MADNADKNEIVIPRTGIPGIDLVSSILEEQNRALRRGNDLADQATTLEEKLAALRQSIEIYQGLGAVPTILNNEGKTPRSGQIERER